MYFNQDFFKLIIPSADFLGNNLDKLDNFCVDSRILNKNDIFIAIEGKKNDGTKFINEAILKGAKGIIAKKSKIDEIDLDFIRSKNIFLALVDNPKEDIIKLAKAWRKKFDYPIIGITGSVGKTSTKELLSYICKINNIEYISSYGNQNTDLGISMNILKMSNKHQVAIFEMGINKVGEMDQIANIVNPTYGIITHIGHSHIEGLGSITDIAKEKLNIFKNFKENNIGIINGDQNIISNISYKHPIIKFGIKTNNHIQARNIRFYNDNIEFILKLYNKKVNIKLNTTNQARIFNSLAATSASYLLSIPIEGIVKGLESNLEIEGRFKINIIKNYNAKLIDDCYNASPESVKAALLALENINSNNFKIAILGDMLELGNESNFWHRQIGRFLHKIKSLNYLILVGKLVDNIKKTLPINLKYKHVENWNEALKELKIQLKKDSIILVKGSRSLNLNNIIKEIVENDLS